MRAVSLILVGLLVLATAAVAARADSSTIAIDNVRMCHRSDIDDAAFDHSGPTATTGLFGPEDLVVCTFFVKGMTAGSRVGVRWLDGHGNVVNKKELAYTSSVSEPHFAGKGWKPQTGWPPGHYTVELFDGGRVYARGSFTVSDLPSEAELKGKRALTAADLGKAGGRRFALLIGVGNYRKGISTLQYTLDDVELVRQVLADPHVGNVPASNFKIVTDTTADKPTLAGIGAALGWLQHNANRPDDTVFVYFSGHGLTYEKKEVGGNHSTKSYLALADTDPNQLEITGLDVGEFNRAMNKVAAQHKIVILDACHSGGGACTPNGDEVRLMSCEDGESSFEEKTFPGQAAAAGHGVFTWFLAAGMKGAADLNGDGVVTVTELLVWVRNRVTAFSRERGRSQTPVAVVGESVIADKKLIIIKGR